MDHFVGLDMLPSGLEFPPELSDRIHFDATARRLYFQGFMSKADFDKLSRLSDDWAYRRPLEDLFRKCMPPPTRPTGLRGLLAAVTSLGF